MSEPLELTQAQKEKIHEYFDNNPNFEKLSIKKVVQFVGGDSADYRDDFGRLVRKYIVDTKLGLRKQVIPPKALDILSPEKREYIKNNIDVQKPVEMARVLFDNPQLTNASPETRLVIDECRRLASPDALVDAEEIAAERYVPPKSFQRVIGKINKYLHSSGFPNGTEMSAKEIEQNLTPKQKLALNQLIGYMNNYEFIHLMNMYDSITDRELLESAFICYTWDKPELTAEEVKQYITLSNESVIGANIQGHIKELQQLLKDESESEDKKIRISLVEAISSARTEYNQCVARKEKLNSALVKKRSDKVNEDARVNASMLELIAYWQNAEKRELIRRAAEERKKKLKDEATRLTNLPDIMVEIWGFSADELIDS
jgi:hypothetical protein